MFDWVIPPQMVVALYIYRFGEVLHIKESFYNSKFARTPQFYSNSGSTGVAVAGSAIGRPTGLTGGVSLIGFVPILGANSCIRNEHMGSDSVHTVQVRFFALGSQIGLFIQSWQGLFVLAN
jgi:hypothetical protein